MDIDASVPSTSIAITGDPNIETDDDTQYFITNRNHDDDIQSCDTEVKDQQSATNLIVGDPSCTYQDICVVIRPQDSDDMLQKWPALAEVFGLSREFIHLSRRKLNLETTHISDVFIEMLINWRCKFGSEATLVTLIDILHEHGFEAMARDLRTKFIHEDEQPSDFDSPKDYRILIGFILFCLIAIGAIVITLMVKPAASA